MNELLLDLRDIKATLEEHAEKMYQDESSQVEIVENLIKEVRSAIFELKGIK